MNFYKEFFLITLEICFAIFIIIFGYAIWDNFDQSEYNTAKYYDNINEFELYIEDNDSYITLIDEEKQSEPTKLYLHNISDKNNNTKLSFKINKDNKYLKNNAIINIDNNYYELNNLEFIEDDCSYYFIIDDIDFEGYETKEYSIKILLKNNYSNNESINYEFVTTL